MKHFRELQPHQVQSTLNLNETRHIILSLAKPIELVAQAIQANIATNEDGIKVLRNKELTRDQPSKMLQVTVESVESYKVDQPRTVCAHLSCLEVRSDFKGEKKRAEVYKTMCHKPCYLTGVPEETLPEK